jgi:hypothetical protein
MMPAGPPPMMPQVVSMGWRVADGIRASQMSVVRLSIEERR